MNSDYFLMRRPLREANNNKILLTPEIVDQIPDCLAHFEVIENQNILRDILMSLDMPEPYGINTFLYQIVFGEKDSSLVSVQQNMLDDFAQKFIIFSSSLPSFPYLLFSNEECITHLLSFLIPPINDKKQNCAMNFLCSIFDHNHERSFIPLSIYKSIFELISENLGLYIILTSILLYSDELPKDIFPFISPIIIKHLQNKNILIARRAMVILLALHEAQIPFDLNLILQCEELFINSFDENIIFELINLMKLAPEPPYQCLDRILQFIGTNNSRLIQESLKILNIFGPYWDNDQRDIISDALMELFYKSTSKNKNFVFTLMAVDVLLTIDRLPVNNTDFFAKVVDMVDIWDNPSVLLAIYTMFTKTCSVSPLSAKEMLLIIKSSRSFENLAQDKNTEVANLAQDILKLVDSIKSDG